MRRALLALPFALAPLLACSSKSSPAAPGTQDSGVDASEPDTRPPVPPDWDRSVRAPTDDDAQKGRSSCAYKAGALPGETQGASHPMGDKIPVQHVVVMMQENRSFDHYFQKLPTAGQTDVEVAPSTYTNPDVDGTTKVAPFRDTQLCFIDTAHGWNAVHAEYDDGKMDGFLRANDKSDPVPPHGFPEMASGKRAMTYYEPSDLPFMFWAANEYAIADHYHCSLLGPTWPNRMYLYAASSFGRTANKPPNNYKTTLFDELETRAIDWKIYTSGGSPGFAMFTSTYLKYALDAESKPLHVFSLDQYYLDAAAGTLPGVAFVDAHLGAEGYQQNDEHPPAMMQVGQKLVADVVTALQKSPNWSSSAFFLTYDEHGGLYDHVVPPAACPPDDIAPELAPGDAPGKFDRYGVRVPLVVISPFAKKHFVGHHLYDHTSIVRFIEARFNLPAMTNRDANAEAPWEMFDFDHPPHVTPPAVPDVPIDSAQLAKCKGWFE